MAEDRIYSENGLIGTGQAIAWKRVALDLGTAVDKPSDPMRSMSFNVFATFAWFKTILARMRTRDGMAIANANRNLRGQRPKMSVRQRLEIWRMRDPGEYSISGLTEVFSVSRPTVSWTLNLVRSVFAYVLSTLPNSVAFSFAMRPVDLGTHSHCG